MNSITAPLRPSFNYDDSSTEEFSQVEIGIKVPFTGVLYKCEMSDDRKYGDIIVNDRVIYRGFFKNELAHGYGTYCFENGIVFEGSFVNGILQGKGSLTSPMHDYLYIGNFHHGSAIGKGRLSHINGPVYVGDFNHNVQARLPIPHGLGELTFEDGLAYEGEFKDGMPYEVKQV